MPNSLTSFKAEYERLLLQFLWRQWSALGLAGYAESQDPWVIDPEALLLFSTVIARKDPRLFDEILDWLRKNGTWINLQRIPRIRKEHDLGDPTVLAAIAAHLAHDSEHHKWKTLSNRKLPPQADAPAPLFTGIAHFGESDPDFLARGLLRPPIEQRGLSQPPRCDRPATFLFKLRSLFGRQSRAEVMAWLLAHETGGHPAEIARQTHYYRRSIQLVLNELERSGHIQSIHRGREKHFTLRHAEWAFLRPKQAPDVSETGFPTWIRWPEVFSHLQSFQQVLNQPKLADMSLPMQAIQIRAALKTDRLHEAGLQHTIPPSPETTGSELLATTLTHLRHLLG